MTPSTSRSCDTTHLPHQRCRCRRSASRRRCYGLLLPAHAEGDRQGLPLICQPPLYRVSTGEGDATPRTRRERDAAVKEALTRWQDEERQRSALKGLGEMNAEQTVETTMNPTPERSSGSGSPMRRRPTAVQHADGREGGAAADFIRGEARKVRATWTSRGEAERRCHHDTPPTSGRWPRRPAAPRRVVRAPRGQRRRRSPRGGEHPARLVCRQPRLRARHRERPASLGRRRLGFAWNTTPRRGTTGGHGAALTRHRHQRAAPPPATVAATPSPTTTASPAAGDNLIGMRLQIELGEGEAPSVWTPVMTSSVERQGPRGDHRHAFSTR